MNQPFVRGLLGLTGGLILGFLCIVGFELITSVLFPFPSGLDVNDREALGKFVETLPVLALLLVLAGYLVGTLIGSWTAAKIGRSPIPGYIVGVLMLGAGIRNMTMFTHPTWFWIAAIVIFVSMTLIGTRLARRAIPSAPA